MPNEPYPRFVKRALQPFISGLKGFFALVLQHNRGVFEGFNWETGHPIHQYQSAPDQAELSGELVSTNWDRFFAPEGLDESSDLISNDTFMKHTIREIYVFKKN